MTDFTPVQRKWGTYRITHQIDLPNEYKCLTKQLNIQKGKSISYQKHKYRNEVWTIVEGEGEVIVRTKKQKVSVGSVVVIKCGELHSIKANTDMTLIEVQHGTKLDEEDIYRFDFDWT